MMLRINIPEGSTEKRARETKPIALAKNTMNRPMIERVDDFMWLFLFDLIYGQFRISPAGSIRRENGSLPPWILFSRLTYVVAFLEVITTSMSITSDWAFIRTNFSIFIWV